MTSRCDVINLNNCFSHCHTLHVLLLGSRLHVSVILWSDTRQTNVLLQGSFSSRLSESLLTHTHRHTRRSIHLIASALSSLWVLAVVFSLTLCNFLSVCNCNTVWPDSQPKERNETLVSHSLRLCWRGFWMMFVFYLCVFMCTNCWTDVYLRFWNDILTSKIAVVN